MPPKMAQNRAQVLPPYILSTSLLLCSRPQLLLHGPSAPASCNEPGPTAQGGMSAGSNMLEGASRALGGEGPRKSDLLEIKPCTGMSDEAWVMKGGEMDDDETDETSTPT